MEWDGGGEVEEGAQSVSETPLPTPPTCPLFLALWTGAEDGEEEMERKVTGERGKDNSKSLTTFLGTWAILMLHPNSGSLRKQV